MAPPYKRYTANRSPSESKGAQTESKLGGGWRIYDSVREFKSRQNSDRLAHPWIIIDFGGNHSALAGILTNLVVVHIVAVVPVAKQPIVAIVHTAQQSSAAVVGPRYIAAIAHIAP